MGALEAVVAGLGSRGGGSMAEVFREWPWQGGDFLAVRKWQSLK